MNDADILDRMADWTGLNASAFHDGGGLGALDVETGRIRDDDDPDQRPELPYRSKLYQRVDAIIVHGYCRCGKTDRGVLLSSTVQDEITDSSFERSLKQRQHNVQDL